MGEYIGGGVHIIIFIIITYKSLADIEFYTRSLLIQSKGSQQLYGGANPVSHSSPVVARRYVLKRLSTLKLLSHSHDVTGRVHVMRNKQLRLGNIFSFACVITVPITVKICSFVLHTDYIIHPMM